MRRYLVFTGDRYYPAGGWGDFLGDYSSLAIAQADLLDKVTKDSNGGEIRGWGHVADARLRKVIITASADEEGVTITRLNG